MLLLNDNGILDGILVKMFYFVQHVHILDFWQTLWTFFPHSFSVQEDTTNYITKGGFISLLTESMQG